MPVLHASIPHYSTRPNLSYLLKVLPSRRPSQSHLPPTLHLQFTPSAKSLAVKSTDRPEDPKTLQDVLLP